jgi:YHS domain-containing protein
VTLTKANPKCAWIVGGKTYEFCCPPCVDEFVKTAKEQPAEIKEPEDYVKKK